jgi:TetR/AcrR family transcriptional repressor of mexJK operon
MIAPSARQAAKADQILSAARVLFLEQGYARASTDAITQAAGVSKQTLYAYFPRKEELLAAVLTRELSNLAVPGHIGETATTLEGLRERLLEVARNFLALMLRADTLALMRLMLGEVAHLPSIRPLARNAITSRVLAVAQTLLQQAADRGLLTITDFDLSARMFIGPLMSYVMVDGLMQAGVPDLPAESTLARLVDLFLRALTFGGTQP